MYRVHHVKCQARWITSWNQDGQEKYQWLQICRWHHPYGRKQRETKEHLDETERRVKRLALRQHSQNEEHGIWSHHFMANTWGNSGNSVRHYFWGLQLSDFTSPQNHCRWWLQPWNEKMLTPWKESYDQHRQHIKKQKHYFANKGLSIQGYGFSSGHVWMLELDYKESCAPKNWCFWTVILEKILESPLECKEIQLVHPGGDQSWVFIGRAGFEAETPIFWPPDAKSWLIWKDPAAGKDWRQEEKGMTEDEMVRWHHWLNGHEFG